MRKKIRPVAKTGRRRLCVHYMRGILRRKRGCRPEAPIAGGTCAGADMNARFRNYFYCNLFYHRFYWSDTAWDWDAGLPRDEAFLVRRFRRAESGAERDGMKRKLKNIAAQLTESEIQELIQIKKMGGKKAVALIRKRDKLAGQLAAIEAELARIEGRPVAKRRGRPSTKGGKAAKGGRKASGRGRVNFSAAVREVFAKAGEPLRARQVVDGLAALGVKVTDPSDMRKRVSVVLAQHKKHFEQVDRGVYRLRDNVAPEAESESE